MPTNRSNNEVGKSFAIGTKIEDDAKYVINNPNFRSILDVIFKS